MTPKEKREKKSAISAVIDLGNGRFKDHEVDTLYDLATRRDEYNGRSYTRKGSSNGWYSDGKYTRNYETTYTIRNDESGMRIDEHYEYHDDDGQTGSSDWSYRTGREILNNLDKVLRWR